MDFKKLYAERKLVRNNLIAGAIVGVLFATLEYYAKLETDSPEAFIPLVIRSAVAGMLIYGTVIVFELQSKYRFIQRPFLYLVLVRSAFYTFNHYPVAHYYQ